MSQEWTHIIYGYILTDVIRAELINLNIKRPSPNCYVHSHNIAHFWIIASNIM